VTLGVSCFIEWRNSNVTLLSGVYLFNRGLPFPYICLAQVSGSDCARILYRSLLPCRILCGVMPATTPRARAVSAASKRKKLKVQHATTPRARAVRAASKRKKLKVQQALCFIHLLRASALLTRPGCIRTLRRLPSRRKGMSHVDVLMDLSMCLELLVRRDRCCVYSC
jgi:hypothetical protein